VRWRRAGLAVGAAVVATEETETLRRTPPRRLAAPWSADQYPELEGMSDEERGALERSATTLRSAARRINARERVARKGRT
jgi:hypothetical protein